MLARKETIFKWVLYALAALLCFGLQGILQHATVWGVLPFLYPLLAVIPATYERQVPGAVFALCIGILTDLLLPGSIPAIYTLVFPLTALISGLIARNLLPSGILCSAACSILAFAALGVFHCIHLSIHGQADAWSVGMFITLREWCVTLPLVIPMTLLFRAVYRKTAADD